MLRFQIMDGLRGHGVTRLVRHGGRVRNDAWDEVLVGSSSSHVETSRQLGRVTKGDICVISSTAAVIVPNGGSSWVGS